MSGLGAGALRDLAARHGVRPSRSLGQNFLLDPNLARAIAAESGVGAGDHVVEVGAGLGSLTLALAATGAEVLAIEFDRGIVSALREVVAELTNVTVLEADAMKISWSETLGSGRWAMCSNLPYNVAVPIVLTMLEDSRVDRFVVMVQREVGERLVAGPGEEGYGAVSLRVAYRGSAMLVRRVAPEVFWPRPKVASVVVRIERLASPPVRVDEAELWRFVDAGFAQRRKTMRNALRRIGVGDAGGLLASCGVAPNARAEELDLATFSRLAGAL